MQRVKTFSSALLGHDIALLERAINEWLAIEQPQITHVAQSALGSEGLVITFVYSQNHQHANGHNAAAAVVPQAFEGALAGAELDPDDDDVRLPLPEAELPY